jgi:hypothetical protein
VELVMTGELLVPGRHPATLSEIENLFVTKAPFSSERSRIFTALTLFIGEIKASLPSATTIWVDGGFVTHKTWAAPHDADVTIPVIHSEWNALTERRRLELHSWFLPNGDKVQPMSGLIDSFVFDLTSRDRARYWNDTWSTVTDEHKTEIPGAVKGWVCPGFS